MPISGETFGVFHVRVLEVTRAEGQETGQFTFGRWRFDTATGDLFDGETNAHLEPQVAKLLEYFLAHQERLISRDELMAEVWDQRIVSDDAINRCISILRQILSPDDKNAYIETVVRRGFISHFPVAPVAANELPDPRRQQKRWLFMAIPVVAILLYLAWNRFAASPAEPVENPRSGPPLVAVLPFSTTGLSEDSEFFANGMHDDLLTQLAQLQSMRVVSRTSVLEYRDTLRNTREIGRELGADAILEGGIQQVGNQIRINMQLIDARTDEHIWARQYNRELLPARLFEVQSEITRSIALALQTSLSEQDTAQLGILPTENMAAYRAYHEAMEIRDAHSANDPAFTRALEDAVALDPNFVRAWAELAGALSLSNFSRQNPESVQRIEEILERIRALAPQSAEYLVAQTYFTYYILKDYGRARQLVDQALALRPNDVHVIELKSWIDRRLGDYDGKIASMREARTLDPKNPLWTNVLVLNLITNHQYDEAARVAESSALKNQGLSILSAQLELREHRDLEKWLGDLEAIRLEFRDDAYLESLWAAYIANRKYSQAEELLGAMEASDDDLGVVPDSSNFDLYPAITHWFLGDTDGLTTYLERAESRVLTEIDPNGKPMQLNLYLELALINAARGNAPEAERLVRTWRREAENDLAVLATSRHFACRALGMAGAAAAAAECIREGLQVPSYVLPFLEPYLPYYDSILESPEFTGLLSEIESG